MSKLAIRMASGLARLWWLTRRDDDENGKKRRHYIYGKAAGTGLATMFVVSSSKGLSMNDLINLVLSNVELLILFAGLLGMFVPKLVWVLGKLAWRGTKAAASWRPKPRAPRAPRQVRVPRQQISVPDGVKCVTREVTDGTRIELQGPAGKSTFTVKRFWSDKKYIRKMRSAFESVKRRYGVKSEITTLGTNTVWNPTRNWKTKDGDIREVSDLDTGHLRNTINVCHEGRSGLGDRVLDEILPKMKKELQLREVNENLFEVPVD